MLDTKSPALPPALFALALPYFTRHEGRFPYFYLDTVGLVTVGIGCMIPDAEQAATLPLYRRINGQPADADLKRHEWQTIHALPKAHLASYYQGFTQLYLPEPEVDALFSARAAAFYADARQHFPGYDSFPVSVQLGLLDLLFSMGDDRFYGLHGEHGYPNFIAAVGRRDWKTCAEHSHRNGVSPTRDRDCAALFSQAA